MSIPTSSASRISTTSFAQTCEETELYFEYVLRKPRFWDFLDSKLHILDERLAKHYGIEGVQGDQFASALTDTRRGGLVTQASMLSHVNHPHITCQAWK